MKDKKLLTLLLVNGLFLITTIITDVLYISLGNAYTYKTIASANFVVCAVINMFLIYKFNLLENKKFVLFMLLGMLFAFAGDVLLIDHFEIGAIAFAVGHIFYTIAYYTIKPFKWLDLAFIGGIIAISLVVIYTSNLTLGSNTPLILAYALIISCMLGKSISLLLENKKIGLIIFVGSLMFFLSDMFLMFRLFGGMGRIGSILCLGLYYPGVYVLATSIGFVNYILSKKQPISK